MIQLEKLRAVNHIVVHDNCPDGVASAMILHDVLPDAKITFCQYGTELQKTIPAEPGMLFCDFSPHQSRVGEFLDVGTLVLDHHGGPAGTVTKEFAEKGLGAFADEKLEPGVCGAVLAFREVWEPLTLEKYRQDPALDAIRDYIRDFATLAGIRDTWQKNDPRWQQACEQAEAVRFWPWERVLATPWDKWRSELLAIGPVLFTRNMKSVERCLKGSFCFTTSKGRQVTVFEGLKQSSDAAEALGDSNHLTIGLAFFMEDGNPKLVFSTRSRGGFNCQTLALAHGGGGHLNAAGFSQILKDTDPHPFELAKRVMARYEKFEDEWTAITSAAGFYSKVKAGELVPKDLFDQLVEADYVRMLKRLALETAVGSDGMDNGG